jgi:hypothetical protein
MYLFLHEVMRWRASLIIIMTVSTIFAEKSETEKAERDVHRASEQIALGVAEVAGGVLVGLNNPVLGGIAVTAGGYQCEKRHCGLFGSKRQIRSSA